MKVNRIHNHFIMFITLLFFLSAVFHAKRTYGIPKKIRIYSVKSLTHILSSVEKENGDTARYVTLKLQIYLEDIYISQGTIIVIYPSRLSIVIQTLIQQGKSRKEIAQEILKRYQNGEFHE